MYALRIGPAVYYAHRDGSPITLVQAVRTAHGCAGVTIERLDGTPVLVNAGSDGRHGWTHAPSGQRLHADSYDFRRDRAAATRPVRLRNAALLSVQRGAPDADGDPLRAALPGIGTERAHRRDVDTVSGIVGYDVRPTLRSGEPGAPNVARLRAALRRWAHRQHLQAAS